MLLSKFKTKAAFLLAFLAVLTLLACLVPQGNVPQGNVPGATLPASGQKDYIKWVDFKITNQAMTRAMNIDIKSYESGEMRHNWIDILAYLGAKYGGDFSKYKNADMDDFVARLEQGQTVEEITGDMKHFSYYRQAYGAVLEQFLGEYNIQTQDDMGVTILEQKYGLKAFSPIAKGYSYNNYDDFGVGRTYGYKRKHLGNDLMALVGTPVVAIESGQVEELGWNQYGGWRIGIRSFDQKRYYYYAHLRKNYPFVKTLNKGDAVKAGDVIGYVGRTGYSTVENTNNITTNHLHMGLQLIFDESQKEGTNQIWIDIYEILKLLSKNKSAVKRVEGSKDYARVYEFDEPSLRQSITAPAFGETPQLTAQVPVIMYHSVLKDKNRSSRYTITPDALRADLEFLRENGYTTIVAQDLIDFVYSGKPLPLRPIILTFDDGHFNNFHYAKPLLEEFGMRAVVSVVGDFSQESSRLDEQNPNYSYLTWQNIKDAAEIKIFEIQNHTYSLHYNNGKGIGISKRKGESTQAYRDRVSRDLTRLQQKIYAETGVMPSVFTYPFGVMPKDSLDLIKDLGFFASFSSETGINTINRGDPECLYKLKRMVRSDKTPLKSLLAEQLDQPGK